MANAILSIIDGVSPVSQPQQIAPAKPEVRGAPKGDTVTISAQARQAAQSETNATPTEETNETSTQKATEASQGKK